MNIAAGKPRTGVISAVSLADRSCTVVVQGGSVPAFLTDQTVDWAAVGATAILTPIGDTYYVSATVGGAGTGGVGESLGTELLTNPDFEYGPGTLPTSPTGWDVEWNYGTGEPLPFGWDTNPADAVSGNGSVLVTIVPGTWTHVMNVVPAVPIRVDTGATYKVSVWVRASNNTSGLIVMLRTYTADTAANCWAFGTGRDQVDHATVTNPGGAYQLLTGTFTVPPGHKYARIVLHTEAPNGADVTASWDQASLRQRLTS